MAWKWTDEPELLIDTWVLLYFKVLPTDPTFQQLCPEQKLFLYKAWQSLPDLQALKRLLDDKKRIDDDASLPKDVQDEIKNWKGVGREGLAEIMKELKETAEGSGPSPPNEEQLAELLGEKSGD